MADEDVFTGPDFDQIALGNDRATSDAIFYLTKKLEEQILLRKRDDRRIAAALTGTSLFGVLSSATPWPDIWGGPED